MKLPKYPLEQLATIKQKKLDEAERELNEKKEALEKEKEKLKKAEKIRDEAKQHKGDKLQQLRDELDQGTTSNVIQRMKHYLKVVDEDLFTKQQKVSAQEKEVDKAKKALEKARQVFFQRQKDVEKLKMHRQEWKGEMLLLMAHEDEIVNDEIGSSMHIVNKKRKRKRKPDG